MLFTIHLFSEATIAGIIESTFDVGSAHLKFFLRIYVLSEFRQIFIFNLVLLCLNSYKKLNYYSQR